MSDIETEQTRSRSRSRDKDRDRKRDRRDRDRKRRDRDDKDKDRDRDRDRSRRRRSDRSRSPRRSSSSSRRRRSPTPEPEPEEPKKDERGDRLEFTVFVSQIHPKVDERDLFEFFSHVGRVEDIRLIRDQRTQKSKMLCYVEFSDKESVHKAVALSGQLIGDYPITIAIIEQEKQKPAASASDGKAMRLYVSELHRNVTEQDLEPVFEAFGPLDFVELHKDPATGKSRGFGFVQYKNEADAQAALGQLNGLDILGQQIKVGRVDEKQEAIGNLGELDEEAGGGVAMTAQSRAALMARLQRDGGAPMGAAAVPAAAAPVVNVPRIQPTTCVIIKNMFNPAEESDPEFHLDIKEDVLEECEKYGKVKHILVDKEDPSGRVFLCMADVAGAQQLVTNFHGRWFASRQIQAEFVVEQTYFAKFPEARR